MAGFQESFQNKVVFFFFFLTAALGVCYTGGSLAGIGLH